VHFGEHYGRINVEKHRFQNIRSYHGLLSCEPVQGAHPSAGDAGLQNAYCGLRTVPTEMIMKVKGVTLALSFGILLTNPGVAQEQRTKRQIRPLTGRSLTNLVSIVRESALDSAAIHQTICSSVFASPGDEYAGWVSDSVEEADSAEYRFFLILRCSAVCATGSHASVTM